MGIADNTPQKGYCIYAHINKLNGKIYIGITKDIKQRWAGKAHSYKQSVVIYNAFKKYGWERFEHLVLWDGMSKEEANKAEQAMIFLFKSIGKSYNITDGGEGRQGVARTEAQKQSAREKMLGRKMSDEARAKMSKSHTGEIQYWKYKKVYAFDKTTKEFVKSYNSISEAAEQLGLFVSAITNAAKGKCPSAGPYIWSYKPTIDINNPRYKMMEDLKVYCYSKEGDYIQNFNNTREASSFVNGIINCINDCCSGRILSYKGYIWRKQLISKKELIQEINELKLRRAKKCA